MEGWTGTEDVEGMVVNVEVMAHFNNLRSKAMTYGTWQSVSIAPTPRP